MSFDRTPAERRVDALSAEARKLRAIANPSREQRARLWAIETSKLPAAWRAVSEMRQSIRPLGRSAGSLARMTVEPYDFTRRTHRLRWWCGYYLRPLWSAWTAPFVCQLRGHATVRSVDYDNGFDTIWCKRCGELLRG